LPEYSRGIRGSLVVLALPAADDMLITGTEQKKAEHFSP
jgi:hypothetical protein